MKFLLDQNVDRRLAPFLKRLGHDVTIIAVDYPHSLDDKDVLAIAVKEKRILVTQDSSDFGELIFRQQVPHNGVLLFRLKGEEANIELRKTRLTFVLHTYASQFAHFLVITAKRVRIRKSVIKQVA